MPPTSPTSDYRWINRGSPYVSAEDKETLSSLRGLYPQLTCANPSYMQARRVDSSIILNSNDIPDNLRYFSLERGLGCFHMDNRTACRNYHTRYKCDGEWTPWRDSKPVPVGDIEMRSTFLQCEKPTDIQARYRDGDQYKVVYGPRDHLRTFSDETLECRNSEQEDGQCSNYSVRYICP
jgi:hypothetical protein